MLRMKQWDCGVQHSIRHNHSSYEEALTCIQNQEKGYKQRIQRRIEALNASKIAREKRPPRPPRMLRVFEGILAGKSYAEIGREEQRSGSRIKDDLTSLLRELIWISGERIEFSFDYIYTDNRPQLVRDFQQEIKQRIPLFVAKYGIE